MLAHKAAELERHPVGVGELKIGNAVPDLVGQRGGLRQTASGTAPQRRMKPASRAQREFVGRVVGAEEAVFVVFVERHQRRRAAAPCGRGR